MAALLLLSAGTPWLLRASAAPQERTKAFGFLGQGTVSFEATSTSVVPTGTLDVTTRVRVGKPVDYLQARLQLYRPTGRLIYQRTLTPSLPASRTVSFRWQRELADLDIAPGVYPIVVTIDSERGDETAERVVRRPLYVYSPENGRTLATVIVRVETPLRADPQGRFAVDPGVDTVARDEVSSIASAVLRDSKLRFSLAIPPMVLQEWKRISQGYETAGPSGVGRVPPTAEVPREYAETLSVLDRALKSGRLELLGQQYSDPDLAALARADLLKDIRPQYDMGFSATFRALETTPSAGTATAGWFVPATAVPAMVDKGVEYAVVSPASTRADGGRAVSGASMVRGHDLIALVTDPAASKGLLSEEATAVVDPVYERQTGDDHRRPLVLGAEIGPGQSATGSDVIRAARTISRLPFAKLVLAKTAAAEVSGPRIGLTSRAPSDSAPSGYWKDVETARSWARSLSGSLGEGAAQTDIATSDTLIAQSSCWRGPDNKWSLADKGLSFAAQGERVADDILSKVSVRVENVTLSGVKGDVPVSIRNDSDHELEVVLQATGQNLRVPGKKRRRIRLKPSDNLVMLPVDLRTSLQGDLHVRVIASPRELAERTVTVRASYLDRLAIVAGVVVVLFVLLIFIVRRVRAAEASDSARAGVERERYTGTTDQPVGDDEVEQVPKHD
ncbi:MAG: hypothetical protein HY876_01905 [Coriobacteriales bacterium]|nr:hypothetical protein [Coriobacteriales bacterium]